MKLAKPETLTEIMLARDEEFYGDNERFYYHKKIKQERGEIAQQLRKITKDLVEKLIPYNQNTGQDSFYAEDAKAIFKQIEKYHDLIKLLEEAEEK